MSVHYKFRSASKKWGTITFDSAAISLNELKRAIVAQEKTDPSNRDFDFIITNAQTGEKYSSENYLIPKNTSVEVKRVPAVHAASVRVLQNAEVAILSNSHLRCPSCGVKGISTDDLRPNRGIAKAVQDFKSGNSPLANLAKNQPKSPPQLSIRSPTMSAELQAPPPPTASGSPSPPVQAAGLPTPPAEDRSPVEKATSATSDEDPTKRSPSPKMPSPEPQAKVDRDEICNIKVAHLNPALTKYNEKLELAKFDPEIRAVIDLMPQWRPIHVENLSQAAARAGKIRRDDLHTVADEFMRTWLLTLQRNCSASSADCSWMPRMDVERFEQTKNPDEKTTMRPAPDYQLNGDCEMKPCGGAALRRNLERAVRSMKHFADRSRIPCPTYKAGDLVMLRKGALQTGRPCDKLDVTMLGPYKVTKVVNKVAFELALPATCRMHNVFHSSLLEPYVPSVIPGRQPAPPDPIVLEGEDAPLYVVNDILDSRFRNGRLFYFLDWDGYPASERTWEPATSLRGTGGLDRAIAEFHRRYPDKPGPGRRRARNRPNLM
ncbi:unnamed protein product (mitochondrion) [Plasmodiophora brassicae]|uniref:Chromo domain-containing protein n=1 Tax=Plasmodiophora brassicae TaxID=37360 RepID=A0A3P3YIN1_PLABS|nr:unnamed protein product [Plasmodiophora brassicae]